MKLAKLIDDSELDKPPSALRNIALTTIQAEAKKEHTFRRSLAQFWGKEPQTLIKGLSVATAVSITLSLLSQGEAGAITFTKIADTNTPIPGGSGNFSFTPVGFPASFNVFSGSVDDNTIAFQGFGPNSQSGIYTSVGEELNVVVDTNTPIPNGSGNFGFGSFGESFGQTFSLDGDSIAFFGLDSNSEQQGIYTSTGGMLNVVVDTTTPIPGSSGNFGFFSGPSLDGDRIAFFGSDSNFEQQGIYTSVGGVLNVVADTNTPIPNGSGNFNAFFGSSLDSDQVAFSGLRFDLETFELLEAGIYTSSEGVLNVVADTNTPIPSGSGNFDFLSDPSLDDGAVAFSGSRSDPETFETLEAGIYASVGGELNVVADFNTSVPDSNAEFCQFDPFFSFNQGSVVFGGSGCDPVTGELLVGGIYTNLGGSLVKVVDFDDFLDGKEIASGLFVGDEALSGNSIPFWVRFTDGSDGIYLADLSPAESVPEPTSVVGLLTVGALRIVLRRKQS